MSSPAQLGPRPWEQKPMLIKTQTHHQLRSVGMWTFTEAWPLLIHGAWPYPCKSVGELASVIMRLLYMIFEKLWSLEHIHKTGRNLMPSLSVRSAQRRTQEIIDPSVLPHSLEKLHNKSSWDPSQSKESHELEEASMDSLSVCYDKVTCSIDGGPAVDSLYS